MISVRRSVIDPALLIWDISDFTSDNKKYWDLAIDLLDLVNIIENSDVKVNARPEFIELLTNSFPCVHLQPMTSDLLDLIRVVYGFLAKESNFDGEYSATQSASTNPNILNRVHFSVELKSELGFALHSLLHEPQEGCVFSNHLISPTADTIFVNSTTQASEIVFIADRPRYKLFEERHDLIYEFSNKHDPVYGFGSKLPDTLTENDLQALLDNSVVIADNRSRCIWSLKAECYIFFRASRSQVYHAYPLKDNELSRVGINPSNIPKF